MSLNKQFSNRTVIKIGALNCQNLKEKIDYPEIHDLISSFGIFGVTETWYGENYDLTGSDIPGYKFYPLNRKGKGRNQRGGIGIFVKNELKEHTKIRYDLSHENFLWCKISKNFLGLNDDLYIGIIYFPPTNSTREKKLNLDHFHHLKSITKDINSQNIILMGDFNARTKNLSDVLLRENDEEVLDQVAFFSDIDTNRANQDKVVNSYGRQLIEYCIATRSYIANGRTVGDLLGKFTCHETRGSSTVDYAIVNENLKPFVRSFQVLDPNTGSDHSAIKLELALPKNHNQLKPKNTLSDLQPKIIWNEETKTKFSEKINSPPTLKKVQELQSALDSTNDNIEEVVSEFIKIVTPDSAKNRPKNMRKKAPKKWYDLTCYEMSKRLKNVAKLYAKSPTNPHLRGSLCKTRKEYKKLLKLKKTEWRKEMISKLEKLEKEKPKEYWKIINELREKKQKETSFNAENFIKFFENLFAKVESNEDEKNIEAFIAETLNKLQNSSEPDFTLEELIFAIKQLKNNKAAGPDRIPAEILKACPMHILKLLLKIMNKIKQKSNYPKRWALGITSLLFKEGDDEDPNNYRAITVSDTISKVLAIMLNARIEKWNQDQNIIHKEQIGFEKNCRPSDHLLVLKTLIDAYTNQGKKLFACFVDFQKAFDSVWRTGLFFQLIKYGLNHQIIKLLKNMYDKTSICLKLNGKLTPAFKTFRGVRQGCNLSPKLFNILINNIPKLFDWSCDPVYLGEVTLNCLMYADDLVLLSTSEAGLQNCLNKLHDYTLKNHLKINMKKTKIIAFHRNGYMPPKLFLIGNQIVEKTKSYKYLGTTITNTGNFKLNEVNLKKKGLRASYLISNISSHAKPSTSIKIFEKVVEPILLYNCEVSLAYFPKTWSYEKFVKNMWDLGSEVNKVVLSFVRQLLGVHKKTTNLATLSETGKYPLSVKIFVRIIKYWFRIYTSQNILLQACLKTNMTLEQLNSPNWYKIVKYLQKATNTSFVPNQNNKENDKIITHFKNNLQNYYKDWWLKTMKSEENKKLDFFFRHKKTFSFEQYLDFMPKNLRQYITRLRTSSHAYPVETLRYCKPEIDRKDRKCTICNNNEVGDEHHYLLKCTNTRLADIRTTFMADIKTVVPQFNQFNNECIIQYCLLMKDDKVLVKTATYAKAIALSYREEAEEKKVEAPVFTRYGRLTKKPVKLDL